MFGEDPVFRRYDAIRLGKEVSPLARFCLDSDEYRGGTILVPRRKQATAEVALGASHLRCDRVLS